MTPPRSPKPSNRALTLEDLAYGVSHDVFDDRLGRVLLRNHDLGINDIDDDHDLLRRIDRERAAELFGERPPFRKPRLPCRELILSTDGTNAEAGIPIDWLCAGLLIAGNTGAGKTNLILWLVLQIARWVQGLWLTDMYKARLRHLRPLLQRLGRDLVVLPLSRCYFNPLQAVGDPRRFCSFISDLLVRILALPPRARTILRSSIHALYDRFGVYSGGRSNAWPNLYDVYSLIKDARDLNAAAREAILDRLGALLASLGDSVAYRRAWSPLDLAESCIVFELLGTSEQAKTLVLSYLLFGLFMFDMENPSRTGTGLRLSTWFEDAQRLFYDGADNASGEMPPFEEIAGVTRESGRGLGLAVQSMHGFPRGLASNMAMKVMGRLGTDEDWQRLGRDMGLSAEQIAWSKLNLRPGRFVMQVANGDWRYPFLATIPEMRVPQSVTDAEAATSVQALAHLPVERDTRFKNWQPFEQIVVIDSASPKTGHVTLDQGESAFLRAVIDNCGRKSSEYADLAGMGQRRALQIRRRLVDRGLLREHEVSKAATGRAAIVLEPLPRAYEALGLPMPSTKGDA